MKSLIKSLSSNLCSIEMNDIKDFLNVIVLRCTKFEYIIIKNVTESKYKQLKCFHICFQRSYFSQTFKSILNYINAC